MNNWFDVPRALKDYRNGQVYDGGGNPAHVDAYLDSLVSHIRHVQDAGLRLGVPEGQLQVHDDSKFHVVEFMASAEHYHNGAPNPDRYARAWLNHIHKNPHHWQHWIFPDGFVPKGTTVEKGVMEMPEHYALEMVADWMGASMVYTGTWDMSDWLIENMQRIHLHSKTAAYVRTILSQEGYSEIMQTQQWAHEVNNVRDYRD